MSYRRITTAFATLALLSLAACTDPAVGDWESGRNACGERSDFRVDDDLNADGTAWFTNTTGCIRCDFDGTFEDRGDGRYDAEVDFDTCTCPSNNSKSANGECRLNDDETRFDCELNFCGVSWEEDFDKLE